MFTIISALVSVCLESDYCFVETGHDEQTESMPAILDVEQPGYFLPTMHSAPRQPSRRVKQTTALHCQRLRIAFISPLFTLSYAKLFFIVCCTNNSVNGDDLAFFRIPNEASERERRGI